MEREIKVKDLFDQFKIPKMNQLGPESEKSYNFKTNLNEVNDVMLENIDKISEREIQMENLVKNTKMNHLAKEIQKQVKNLKCYLLIFTRIIIIQTLNLIN